MKKLFAAVFCLTIIFIMRPALGQEARVPAYLNFQSLLTDGSGNALGDAFVDLEFRLVNAAGSEVYSEKQTGVQVVNGVVNVLIGEGTVIGSDGSVAAGGLALEDLDPAEGPHALQVTVNGETILEDLEIVSSPYSLWSGRALSVVPDSIGSEEIRDGSIQVEDLEPGLAFSDIEGEAADGQIPETVTRNTQLEAHLEDGTAAHAASAISVSGVFVTSSGTSVQELLEDLDQTLTQEITNRRLQDESATDDLTGEIDTNVANLQTQINTATANITTVQGDVTTLQGNVTTLQTDVTALQNTASDINNLPGTLGEGKIDASIARDSELATLNASNLTSGEVDNARLSSNVSLLGSSIESSEIFNNTITNEDINSSAGIAWSKISKTGAAAGDVGASPAGHSHTAADVGAASADHNHDLSYSPVGHNHDTIYAVTDHDHDGSYVNVGGDTMSGSLNMGGNNVTNAANYFTSSGVDLNDHESRIDALEEDELECGHVHAWGVINGSTGSCIRCCNISGCTPSVGNDTGTGDDKVYTCTFNQNAGSPTYPVLVTEEAPDEHGGYSVNASTFKVVYETASHTHNFSVLIPVP